MGTGKNFEYLGSVFQLQLLNQIIIDKEYFEIKLPKNGFLTLK
jgi:hypothetical protein